MTPTPRRGSRDRAAPPIPRMFSWDRAGSPPHPAWFPGTEQCPPPCPTPPWGTVQQLGVSAADVEVLRQDPDSMSRRFYHSVLEDISELSQFVTH